MTEKLINHWRMKEEQLNGQTFLYHEISWVGQLIQWRLTEAFKNGDSHATLNEIQPIPADNLSGPYAAFVTKQQLSFEERFLLAITLVPHVSPNFIDDLLLNELEQQGDFPQLGGLRGVNFRGFQPTLETALFILAGDDLSYRLKVQSQFISGKYFNGKQIVFLGKVSKGEPITSGKLMMEQEYIDLFSMGVYTKPQFSPEFPAELLQTTMEWDDLVLNEQTLKQIKHLEMWLKHHKELQNLGGRKYQSGYRVLFYGPPGTGKTLTASLLGKFTQRDVFKIDLSLVVSKYIGETEKNLGSLFDKAKDKDWILFFDEADALFGKRTSVTHAHDRYANQEVSFLLQRVQNYSGMVILATNFKGNMDEAFNRRFQMFIQFPMPRATERKTIWEKAFPEKITLSNEVNIHQLANDYELSGSNIINITQYACLKALTRESHTIHLEDINEGIRNEMYKEGKVM